MVRIWYLVRIVASPLHIRSKCENDLFFVLHCNSGKLRCKRRRFHAKQEGQVSNENLAKRQHLGKKNRQGRTLVSPQQPNFTAMQDFWLKVQNHTELQKSYKQELHSFLNAKIKISETFFSEIVEALQLNSSNSEVMPREILRKDFQI